MITASKWCSLQKWHKNNHLTSFTQVKSISLVHSACVSFSLSHALARTHTFLSSSAMSWQPKAQLYTYCVFFCCWIFEIFCLTKKMFYHLSTFHCFLHCLKQITHLRTMLIETTQMLLFFEFQRLQKLKKSHFVHIIQFHLKWNVWLTTKNDADGQSKLQFWIIVYSNRV